MSDTNSPTIILVGTVATAAVALILGIANMIKEIKTGAEGRVADSGARRAEGTARHAEAVATDNATWFAAANNAFDRVDTERQDYRDRFNEMSVRFYDLLEGCEERVVPLLLLLPNTDPVITQLKKVFRELLRHARQPDRHAAPPDPTNG